VPISVSKEFNIGEMENKDKFAANRSIEDNLFSNFNKTTPQCIWSFWDQMVNEYRIWNGTILTNKFEENRFI